MPEPRKAKKKFVPIVEEAPPPSPAIHGRSASWNPANRFEKLHVDLGDVEFEHKTDLPSFVGGHSEAELREHNVSFAIMYGF